MRRGNDAQGEVTRFARVGVGQHIGQVVERGDGVAPVGAGGKAQHAGDLGEGVRGFGGQLADSGGGGKVE